MYLGFAFASIFCCSMYCRHCAMPCPAPSSALRCAAPAVQSPTWAWPRWPPRASSPLSTPWEHSPTGKWRAQRCFLFFSSRVCSAGVVGRSMRSKQLKLGPGCGAGQGRAQAPHAAISYMKCRSPPSPPAFDCDVASCFQVPAHSLAPCQLPCSAPEVLTGQKADLKAVSAPRGHSCHTSVHYLVH